MSKAGIPEWASSALMLVIAAVAAFLIWSLAAENQELNGQITDLRVQLNSLQETTALQISFVAGGTIPSTRVGGPAGRPGQLRERGAARRGLAVPPLSLFQDLIPLGIMSR